MKEELTILITGLILIIVGCLIIWVGLIIDMQLIHYTLEVVGIMVVAGGFAVWSNFFENSPK